jgi:type I restriction-modification system DNA methylase subunit
LTAITSRAELKKAFIAYLDGFSKNVKDIIDKFGFRGQIDKLSNSNTLGILIQKFVDRRINLSNRPALEDDGIIKQPALDNHTMGMVFEEVIRRFNEETNVTDAGRHFTPRDIVQLMADLAFIPVQDIIKAKNDTYTIYDPCYGSGAMFVQSTDFVKNHAGNIGNLSVYGQDSNPTTCKMALMNPAIRGSEADPGGYNADTFHNDLHKTLKADFILANPPFNLSDRNDGSLNDDPRWKYGLPPSGNANFAWLQYMLYHLAPNGKIGMVLVNGSLSSQSGGEGEIRKKIVEDDLVEGIIATSIVLHDADSRVAPVHQPRQGAERQDAVP